MVKAGDGYHFHVTGLTHDERGYPVITPECQEELVSRLMKKIRNSEESIRMMEQDVDDDTEVVILSYGISSRIVTLAIEKARSQGIKVGILRPITLFPYPYAQLQQHADHLKGVLVVEMNAGQMVEDVRLGINGKVPVRFFGRMGGMIPSPDDIVQELRTMLNMNDVKKTNEVTHA